jgi:acyl-CoA reductase-like NAD-dependent aldehyde dehydrogenase
MATIEDTPRAADELAVENPATGETIRTVPIATAEDVRAMAERGRAAQPAWQALGFEVVEHVRRRALRPDDPLLSGGPTHG